MDKLLKEIYDYGIGYDDSISVIAIPLIVALFAFAFPLLFQVITHIEGKYASEKISEMFRRSKTYRWFWWSTYFSMGYLFIFGVLTITLQGANREKWMCISKGTNLAVAAFYSLAIIAFVRMCIRFNNPGELLEIVGEQYRNELRYEEIKLAVLRLNHLRDKIQFWRSKGWKSFRQFSFHMSKVFGHYQSSEDYGKRIEDICKYAIETGNKNLFRSVMDEVNKITNSERETRFANPFFNSSNFEEEVAQPKTQQFYEHMFEYICLSGSRSYFEDELVRKRICAFNQSQYPFEDGVVSIVRDVIMVVEAGHYGVYEKYIDESDYKYLFIMNLPTKAYIMGAEVNAQASAERKKHEVWHRMVDLHFLMNAYLFARGYYRVLTTVQTARYYYQGHLYPHTPNELLATYARLNKGNLGNGGYYYHWSLKEIFGRDIDEQNFLEKYVVVMMMLCSEKYGMEEMTVSGETVNVLSEHHERLLRVAKYLKQNRDLTGMYPQLSDIDFYAVYEDCMKSYEEGNKVDGDQGQKESFWFGVKNWAFGWLCTEKMNGLQSMATDIYSCRIPEENRIQFENDLMLAFRNTGWMPRGLKEEEKKGKLCSEDLQALSMLLNKQYVCHYNHEDASFLYRHFEIVFEQRCMHMFYSAVNNMQKDNKTVKVTDFESFFKRYTKNRKNDYIIIDTECSLSAVIDVDRKDHGYKRIYLDASEYLKDIPLAEEFRNSLLIMRKEDFPSLFKKSEEAEPAVVLKDESDREKGMAAMTVTITPNMEMRYYQSSRVMKVTLVR